MNWFKNLNATPRLMLSFGVLMFLIAAVSYLSISSSSKANDRVETLYHKDMIGATKADGITINVATIGRLTNNAIVYAAKPELIASDQKEVLANLAEVHANLDAADKLFVNKEGIAALAVIRNTLPAYEQAIATEFRALEANDVPGALKALDSVAANRKIIREASDIARARKQAHAEQSYLENNEAFQSSRTMILAVTAIAIVLGVILSIFIARGFSVPLGRAVAALVLVAAGDLTVTVEVHTKDEVGRMAKALNEALEKLRSTLQEVATSAENSNTASKELAAAAEQLASGAQEQAASLEETSASLEQITAAVRQSADNAKQASQLATGSRESAEKGQDVVSGAIAAMAEINTASAKISDIISTINEIAFQTNLLAVNAAVEAARAGEEGRGFAVVATEVRSLAQRSAEAAKEIKGLIQDSLQKVENGSELVNRSGTTLQGIVGSVKRVTDIVGEIAAASAEQSTGVDQVNSAITQMDQVTQSNSAQTEELSSTAQSLAGQAAHLLQLVGAFTLSNSRESSRGGRGHQPSPQSHRHPAAAARRPATPTARAAAHRSPSPSGPGGRKQPAVLVGAPEARSDDASFEEF